MATNRGWFYHDGEAPLTPERLFQMYLETVGRNATLILNIPPNKAGVLPDASVNALKGMGDLIKARLGNDLAKNATIEVSETRTAGAARNYEAANLIDGNKDTYWATNDGTTSATITLTWDTPQTIRYVELMEYIAKGQRVKGIVLYRVCAMPALRADVPAHFPVAANFHTGSPLSITGEQINGIRKGRKVILVLIQMPGANEFEIQ